MTVDYIMYYFKCKIAVSMQNIIKIILFFRLMWLWIGWKSASNIYFMHSIKLCQTKNANDSLKASSWFDE